MRPVDCRADFALKAAFLDAEPDIHAFTTNANKCLTPENLAQVNVSMDYDHDGMGYEEQQAILEFAAACGKVIGLHPRDL